MSTVTDRSTALLRLWALLPRVGMASLGITLVAIVAACGGGSTSDTPAGVDNADAAPDVYAYCSDYSSWRDAQDALESDYALSEYLDEDGDDAACNELAQAEYDEGWVSGQESACEWVFLQSPDGMLYSDGTGYTSSDCDLSGSSSGEWDSYETYEEPFDLGERQGWATLCDDFFNYQVAGDLYWGDDEVVLSSLDCEAAGP